MKSKFTSVIMGIIITAICITVILLGIILLDELNKSLDLKDTETIEQVGIFETDDIVTPDEIEENKNTKSSVTNNNTSNPLAKVKSNTKEKQITQGTKNTTTSEKITQGDQNTTTATNEQIDYNDISINKYFYKQLDKYAKIIYNAFEKNKEEMKSGTYTVEFGNAFSDLLKEETGQDELGRYYQSAIEAYIYDNPDVFYLSPNKMYLNIETTKDGNEKFKTSNTYINSGEDINYLIDGFNSKSQVDKALKRIENVRNIVIENKTGNTYEDIKNAHDFLIDNIEYDSSLTKENIYDIYGALVKHECVCEGYAKSLKYLLDGLEIESTLGIGKGINSQGNEENHAWVYVKLEDNWYAVDPTWDDPVVVGGYSNPSAKYEYFLKGTDNFYKDHTPSGTFTENGQEFTYPNISKKDY